MDIPVSNDGDRDAQTHWNTLQARLRQCDEEARALTDKLTLEQLRLILTDDDLFDLWSSGAPDSVLIDKLDEAKANARLIAAAPDLLAALERCVPWVGKLIADGGHERCAMPNDAIMTLAQAEAAIEKATP